MFVCLKNIFANDSFDDIVLREYADLEENLREIYRYVSAMENAGVRVHRQLILRLLGIEANSIQGILDNLTDIVSEYNIYAPSGIYGWRTRHSVIAGLVTKYKFPDLDRTIALFDAVIDNISPTYDIEIRSLRELCNVETGIARIPDKNVQTLADLVLIIAPALGSRSDFQDLTDKIDTLVSVREGSPSTFGFPSTQYRKSQDRVPCDLI